MKLKNVVRSIILLTLCVTACLSQPTVTYAGSWTKVDRPYDPDGEQGYEIWLTEFDKRFDGTDTMGVDGGSYDVGWNEWGPMPRSWMGFNALNYVEDDSIESIADGKAREVFQWNRNLINGVPDPNDDPPASFCVRIQATVSAGAISDDSPGAAHRNAGKENAVSHITVGSVTKTGTVDSTTYASTSSVASIDQVVRVSTDGEEEVEGPWVELYAKGWVGGDRNVSEIQVTGTAGSDITQFSMDVVPPVAVAAVQWRNPAVTPSTYADPPSPFYVLKGTRLVFKAFPSPTGSQWPAGEPTWGGAASGTGETAEATFNTVSTSLTDYKTVTVTAGNTVTVNVIVYELTPATQALSQFTGRSESQYGVGELVFLVYTTQPAGITVNIDWRHYSGPASIGTGTDFWLMKDLAGTVIARAWIKSGPSKDEYRTLTRSVVAPTLVLSRHGTDFYHEINTVSVGMRLDAYLLPGDVSFSGIGINEGSVVGSGTGDAACGGIGQPPCDTHAESGTDNGGSPTWKQVGDPDLVKGSHVGNSNDYSDYAGVSPIPIPSQNSTFTYEIPWRYSINRVDEEPRTPRLIRNVTQTLSWTTTGQATITKDGISVTKNYSDASGTLPHG
jgi:hypothetical protein